MMKFLIFVSFILLVAQGCVTNENENHKIEITIEPLPEGKYEITMFSTNSVIGTIHLSKEKKIEKILNPINYGNQILSLDTITGHLFAKVTKDTDDQIQGVAYSFSKNGLLKGAYEMENGKNKNIGFLYSDGLNSLDAVFLYDSLGNLVETREY